MRCRFKYGVFLLLISLTIFSELYCDNPIKKKIQPIKEYASLADSTKYVGMNTCRECHESIYQSYIETGMGRSFEKASIQKSAAEFGTHEVVYDKYLDYFYHPKWNGDSLQVTEFRLANGDTIHQRTETVSYIVGSGQHTNSHIMNEMGYLSQVPVTFYTQKAKWDMAPGFENGNNTRFKRIIGLECISCHNAYPDFVLGSENKYKSVPQGIDCERCHGPGSSHVELKREGVLVDVSKEIDYSIVNPAKLPVNLQFDVCQRCHIQGNAVLNKDKSFFDFRPGMALSSVMNVFMPVYSGKVEEHIMASHAERLKQSQCYISTTRRIENENTQKAGNALKPYQDALTCITCHNPHKSVKVTSNLVFNQACKSCHNPKTEVLCLENELKRNKINDNCVGCHMPVSGATDIPHVRVTDHRIRVPVSEEKKKEIKKFLGIISINNPHPDPLTLGLAYIAYFEKFGFDKTMLDSAVKYIPDGTKEDITINFEHLVHLYFLKNDFDRVLKYLKVINDPLSMLVKKSYTNTNAWTCYRIAEAYTNKGASDLALPFYQRAVKLAPFMLDFRNKYGACLMENNNSNEARVNFEFIIKENPLHYQALSNLGFLYLTLDSDTAKARLFYDKAISLNPDYENALLNKAGLYIYRQQFTPAANLLKKLLVKNPANQRAKQMLIQLKSRY